MPIQPPNNDPTIDPNEGPRGRIHADEGDARAYARLAAIALGDVCYVVYHDGEGYEVVPNQAANRRADVTAHTILYTMDEHGVDITE